MMSKPLSLQPFGRVMVAILAVAAAAAAENPDMRVVITPLMGPYYRPGAWLAVRVQAEVPPEARGVFSPTLEVLPPQGDAPLFSARQPARAFAGGEIFVDDFWLMAGELPPRLRFALYGEAGLALCSAPAADILRPAATGWRILISLASAPPAPRTTHVAEIQAHSLPSQAALYESVDIIIAGDLSGHPLPLPTDSGAFDAIAEWVAGGGALLVFDRLWGERLEQAIADRGWPRRPRTPFVLASESGIAESPPLALHLGNGWIVFFEDKQSPVGRGLAGQAVWEKLRRGCLRSPAADYRLMPQRRKNTPVVQPPRLSASAAGRWLAIWLILLAGALAPLGISRWRGAAWPAAIVSVILAILLATAIIRREPIPTAHSISALVKTIGETGREGPAREEEIRLLSPFDDLLHLEVIFHGLPPPRLLGGSSRELAEASCELFYDERRTEGKIIFRAPHLLRRGRTLICGRTRLTAAAMAAPLLCRVGNIIHLEALADDRRVWHHVLVRAQQQEWAATTLGPLQRGSLHACNMTFAALPRARREFMAMIAAEQAAGNYGVLLGWEEGAPTTSADGIFLGTLQVQGLNAFSAPK